jgi:CheY-like chemotaxis protein
VSATSILVVEDDHDTRVSLRYLLEERGYNVLSAPDGSSALDVLHKAHPKPTVILLDLMLPVMNGWSFAERVQLRPDLRKIPIVVMSAFQDPPPPDGVVAFCKKPLDVPKLLELLGQFR